jgi:hypothetical protein
LIGRGEQISLNYGTDFFDTNHPCGCEVCTIQPAPPDIKCEPGVRVLDEEIKKQSKKRKTKKKKTGSPLCLGEETKRNLVSTITVGECTNTLLIETAT